jgi:DNA-binding MarR family transcriptional regulator
MVARVKDVELLSARRKGSNDPDVVVEKWRAIFPNIDYESASLWTRMRLATRVLVDATTSAIAPYDLTLPDFDVLAALYREPEPRALTIAALAEATSRTHGSVSVHSKSLGERGLVKRVGTSLDARMSLLQLTRKGIALVESVVPLIVSAQAEITVTLTRDERRALAGLLRKITQQKQNRRVNARKRLFGASASPS